MTFCRFVLQAVNENVLPDAVIYLTIYLLEMAASLQPTATPVKVSKFFYF